MAVASLVVRLSAQVAEFQKSFEEATRSTTAFEKKFAGTASSVADHQQRINKAFASFAGDNIIAEANALAAALNRVGGAAKLTEAEQRRVNATVTEAIAKYQALGITAPKSLTDIANATKKVADIEPQVTLAGRAMGVLSSAFGQFTLANLAATAIQNVVGRLSEFVAQGQKLPGMEASFEKLTRTVGQNSQEMLSAMQSATRGLVSNLDLMQSANKAILLGLPVTTKEMGELAKTATVLGKAMGLDATTALDNLITALGRSSPLILDNLGLTVKLGEANEAYAAKLGKTASQLTDAESKMAFYEAAMEAARRKTQEIGEQTKTLGEIIETAWVSIGNVVSSSVATINVGVGRALSSGKEFAAFAQDVIRYGVAVASLNAQLREQSVNASKQPPKLTPQQIAFDEKFNNLAALQALQREAKAASAALAPLTAQQRELALEFIKGGRSASEIAEKLNKVAATAGVTERQIQPLIDRIKTSSRSVNEQAQALRELDRATIPLTASQKHFIDQQLALNRSETLIAKALKVSSEAVKDYADSWKEYAKDLEVVRKIQDGISKLPGQQLQAPTGIVATNQFRIDPNQFPIQNLPGVQMPVPQLTPEQERLLRNELKRVQDQYEQTWGVIKTGAKQFGRDIAQILADGIRTGDWSQAKDAFQDAVAEFLSAGLEAGVNKLVPGLGTLMKPLIDAVSDKIVGLFRDREHEKVNDLRDAFFGQFGVSGFGEDSAFHNLAKQLHALGAAGDAMFKRLIQADKVAEFEAAVDDINKALGGATEVERMETRLAALGSAIDGVNKKAALFAEPFEKLITARDAAEAGEALDAINAKISATAQAGQAEFERLGQFAAAAFAGLVRETGDALGAINQLAPAFAVLQRGVNEFGLTSTGTIDSLLEMFNLVNDAVTGPILQSIQATGQIFTGLQTAGILTSDLFQTVAADIGASFRELEAKGGDVAKAMALSQPILQKLWEGQQLYGEITDETTAALLRQAEEQGLVGAHMKDVNQKILDVLIAIADVFGAKIPDSMRATTQAGAQMADALTRQQREAANNIQREFDRIRIDIPVSYDDPGFEPRIKSGIVVEDDGQPRLVELASGGVVRRPTLALVGEAGPEAVIPLSQLANFGGPEAGTTTVIVEMDGRTVARTVVPHIPGEVRRLGYV